jgi:hypothetical protein
MHQHSESSVEKKFISRALISGAGDKKFSLSEDASKTAMGIGHPPCDKVEAQPITREGIIA